MLPSLRFHRSSGNRSCTLHLLYVYTLPWMIRWISDPNRMRGMLELDVCMYLKGIIIFEISEFWLSHFRCCIFRCFISFINTHILLCHSGVMFLLGSDNFGWSKNKNTSENILQYRVCVCVCCSDSFVSAIPVIVVIYNNHQPHYEVKHTHKITKYYFTMCVIIVY